MLANAPIDPRTKRMIRVFLSSFFQGEVDFERRLAGFDGKVIVSLSLF